jgi:inosose dehydratase
MKSQSLPAVLAFLALAFFGPPAHAAEARLNGLLGFESFGLRQFPLERVITTTRELNLDYVEIFGGHLKANAEPAKIEEALRLLAANRVKVSGLFVGNVVADEKVNRTYFEFARRMGTRIVIANKIDERGIAGLNRLCEEYPEVRVCLHNHGPKSQGETLAQVQALLAKTHPHVGACIDTGHVMRSREDPVAWARALQGRVFGVHLKEYHGHRPLGAGIDLPLKEFLLALADGGFPDYGALTVEFEGTPEDPFKSIATSVDYVRQLLNEINSAP